MIRKPTIPNAVLWKHMKKSTEYWSLYIWSQWNLRLEAVCGPQILLIPQVYFSSFWTFELVAFDYYLVASHLGLERASLLVLIEYPPWWLHIPYIYFYNQGQMSLFLPSCPNIPLSWKIIFLFFFFFCLF